MSISPEKAANLVAWMAMSSREALFMAGTGKSVRGATWGMCVCVCVCVCVVYKYIKIRLGAFCNLREQ